MADHNGRQLSTRELVRAHAYPVFAAVASFSLLAIALLQVPQAVKTHRYNRCIDVQVSLRSASNLKGQQGPGKLIYLKAVQHCEGL
ncbi:hypothetical protein [Synechococcus sp. W4D4]|uniref:hypothetical protein n=1 Tax=Synechococcus sp. W4D4 TaxID=3392294 RepID=UPI0039E8D415